MQVRCSCYLMWLSLDMNSSSDISLCCSSAQRGRDGASRANHRHRWRDWDCNGTTSALVSVCPQSPLLVSLLVYLLHKRHSIFNGVPWCCSSVSSPWALTTWGQLKSLSVLWFCVELILRYSTNNCYMDENVTIHVKNLTRFWNQLHLIV